MIVDIIVLSKDNPTELRRTLSSCCLQYIELPHIYFVTVVDSSFDFSTVSSIITDLQGSSKAVKLLLKRHYPPDGIYSAMNFALNGSDSDCLLFMNSGDTFYDSNSLYHLYTEYITRSSSNPHFKGCFGRTQYCAYSSSIKWTAPPSQSKLFFQWLSIYYPCHQSILFNTSWAKKNSYNRNRCIDADSLVIKALTNEAEHFSFITNIVCSFQLNGVSSRAPKLSTVFQSFKRNDDRSYTTKLLIKAILSPSFLPFNLSPLWIYLRYRINLLKFHISVSVNGK